MTQKNVNPFDKLVGIMARLRSPNGCPWDLEQDFQSITPHTLEETYEVISAIEQNDFAGLCEELGDLLLQVVFYAQMASEKNLFTIEDVIEGICQKLIHRHPHIFADTKVENSTEVLKNWEELKQQEKNKQHKTMFAGVPKALPALLRASRLGEKASRVGFDWKSSEGALNKVTEELTELNEAMAAKNPKEIDHEFGDLLQALANVARWLKVDPEGALRRSTDRFVDRFTIMEKQAKQDKRTLQSLNTDEWNHYWEQAKQASK